MIKAGIPTVAGLADLPDDHPVFKHCAHYLAGACVNLVLLASPEKIVIGYVTFRLSFHHFDLFELDLRGHLHVRCAAFSCPRLKWADMVLI